MAKSKTTTSSTAKKPAAKKTAAKKPAAKKAAVKKAPAKKAVKAPAKATKVPAKPAVKAAKKAVSAKEQKPVKTAKPVKATPVKATTAKPTPAKTTPVKPKTVATVVTKPAKDMTSVKENKVEAAPKKAANNAGGPTGVLIPPDYNPGKDKGDFMNPVMKEYFRLKLIRWREELLRESSETIHNTLQGTELQKPDMADRASAETDHALELRTRDRERKLISKINEALLRLDDDSYGYCEETGEPIAVARLDARPIATLSIEAQERHERMEKTHRDD